MRGREREREREMQRRIEMRRVLISKKSGLNIEGRGAGKNGSFSFSKFEWAYSKMTGQIGRSYSNALTA